MPALSINAPVIGISIRGGVLDPPKSLRTVGWWSEGAEPGATTGTAALIAHSAHRGGGVFDNLGRLGSGDQFTVTTGGRRLVYTVTKTTVYSKNKLPQHAQEIFGQSGPGRLVLVSCENWDGTAWTSNVVVFARPA